MDSVGMGVWVVSSSSVIYVMRDSVTIYKGIDVCRVL